MLLDEEQQKKEVQSLEQQQARQGRLFRRLFAVVAYMFCTAMALLGLLLNRRFGGLLSFAPQSILWLAMPVLFVSATAYCCIGAYVEQDRFPFAGRRGFQYATAALCGVPLLYWGSAWMNHMHLAALWLPLGPAAYYALCMYISFDVRRAHGEIETLRHLMYPHKGV